MPVSMRLETIKPEQAARVLKDHNPRNRGLRDTRVELLSQALGAGEWMVNGETIKFDTEGNLIDGQHRLAAIERAGIAAQSYVCRGLPPEAQETIDIGSKRTAADMLALRGYPDVNRLSAIGSMLWAYEHDALSKAKSARATMTALVEYIVKSDTLILEATRHASHVRNYIRTNTTASGTAYAIFARLDAVEAREFFLKVKTGENLSSNAPALRLRNRLIKEISESRQMSTNAFLAIWIKAWNAHRQDQPIQVLHWKGFDAEGFPGAR